MPGKTLHVSALPGTAETRRLPRSLLYSIFARIGGSGLDVDAFETLRASYRGGFLGKAIAYANRQREIPRSLIKSLHTHPVRLLSSLDRPYYYGAKKKYLDRVSARALRTGRYDMFHSWSGDCLQTLRLARQLRIPSLLEIPTWHRDFGEKVAPRLEPRARTTLGRWKDGLVLRRESVLAEYDLATLLLVLSEKAAETFREAGFSDDRMFYLPRGVDVEKFQPGERPPVFRAIFSGALIKRKGVHHLLEAWHRLKLRDAELWLVGTVHDEMKPYLKKFWRDNIRVVGFVTDMEKCLAKATVHVFPSQLEGNAKVTCEAAACGLPQITTREAGDIVRDGIDGLIVPPADVDALAAAIENLYLHQDLAMKMGAEARRRVVENFTWDHYRERLLRAYERAFSLM